MKCRCSRPYSTDHVISRDGACTLCPVVRPKTTARSGSRGVRGAHRFELRPREEPLRTSLTSAASKKSPPISLPSRFRILSPPPALPLQHLFGVGLPILTLSGSHPLRMSLPIPFVLQTHLLRVGLCPLAVGLYLLLRVFCIALPSASGHTDLTPRTTPIPIATIVRAKVL